MATGTTLTQRDWLINLAEVLGWSFGLPDVPSDADYLELFAGDRLFRFEAEDFVAPEDPVAIKSFQTFGPFSGSGWLSGTTSAAAVNLRLLLPHGGRYTVAAAARLPGHRVRIGQSHFTLDADHRFSRIPLGTVELPAGPVEVELTIPPNGGIDYLEFSAPHQPPVEPPTGWDLDAPLTLEIMASTAVQILQLQHLLPPGGAPLVIEAENLVESDQMATSRESYLGQPSGNGWLRAGAAPVEFPLVFDLPTAGIYDLSLRCAGGPVTMVANGQLQASAYFPDYLETRDLGTFDLRGGQNNLSVRLPPRGGIDAIYLRPRTSDIGAYRRLAGLAGDANPPTGEQVESLLALLAILGNSLPR